MILKNALIDYWREIHKEAGYQEISTPIILSRALWERSGHWDHYKDNMLQRKKGIFPICVLVQVLNFRRHAYWL